MFSSMHFYVIVRFILSHDMNEFFLLRRCEKRIKHEMEVKVREDE